MKEEQKDVIIDTTATIVPTRATKSLEVAFSQSNVLLLSQLFHL